MSETTLVGLKEAPSAIRDVLIEITTGEQLQETWTQHGTYTDTYYISYLYETINLQDGTSSKINKSVVSMKYDGTALTVQTSIVNCNTNNNSYWHDTANKLLYVHLDNGSTVDPTDAAVLVAYFKMFFTSNNGVYFNDDYYEPYVIGAPGIRQTSDHLLTGKSALGGGNLALLNTSGFFDVIIEKFIWLNRSIKLLYGGDDLPYSEYGDGFTGVILNKAWSMDEIIFEIKNIRKQLLRQIPEDSYTISEYPNLAEWAVGLPKPIAYGKFDSVNPVKAIPIDELYGTNQVQYSIAGHLIFALNEAEISYDSGATWAILTYNATPANSNEWGTFDLTNATFVVQFTSGNYVSNEVLIRVAFEGRENSDTTLMASTSDVIADLLTNYNGFVSADLDSTEFAAAKTESRIAIAIYINTVQRTLDIIEKIAISDLGRFYVDNSGLFVYHVWSPYRDWSPSLPTGLIDLDAADLLDYRVRYNSKDYFTKIKIGYKQSPLNNNYRFISKSNTDGANKYGESKQKLIHTYITTVWQAENLAARLLLLHAVPLLTIEGRVKMQLIEHNIGENITLTLSDRVPESGGWAVKMFQLISLTKDFINKEITFKADDLRDIGSNIGYWMNSSAPNYASSSVSEREQSGYWSTSNGYAEVGESAASLNISKWW